MAACLFLRVRSSGLGVRGGAGVSYTTSDGREAGFGERSPVTLHCSPTDAGLAAARNSVTPRVVCSQTCLFVQQFRANFPRNHCGPLR